MRRTALALTLILALLVSTMVGVTTVHFGTAQSGTSVSGTIYSDTTWTQAGSPYTFNGTVVVNNGVTLTIQAGVTVNLNGYILQVNGTLQAIGSATNQIQFETAYINRGVFEEISFMPSSNGWNQQTSSGCVIQNANLTTPISITNAAPLIDSNNFILRFYPAISGSGSPIISNNIIYMVTEVGPEAEGIDLDNPVSAIIANNTIGFMTSFQQSTQV